MIGRAELRSSAAKSGVSLDNVQRDYVLSWVLKGLYENVALGQSLVFKGGTALRKAYFSDYRFSQDLDFTLIRALKDEEITTNLEAVIKTVGDESGISFLPNRLKLEKTRDVPGEEAYEARLYFFRPGQHRGTPMVVRIEMTCYEEVMLSPERKPLHHPYSDASSFADLNIIVYRLEEVLAEKLRAILLQRRYAAPRDLYDIWYLRKNVSFNLDEIMGLFQKKCEYKGLDWRSASFDELVTRRESFQGAWMASLTGQLAVVPDFDEVFAGVTEFLRYIIER